ncbi:hypothetical protein [Kitasatospora sp. NPDC059571]|uniref:hypothetical protein n=1 Tax=Kitasatospora sp. NPDC059571 TaxID=3346871 RepID=UPI0036BF6A9B
MDFTSDGTDGPRLDAASVAQLGLGNNVWGSLPGTASAQRAAELFFRAGWRVRRSNRTEFQVENECAELELTPLEPVVFSGFVAPDRITDLLAALNGMGLSFSVEFEDREGGEHVFGSPDRATDRLNRGEPGSPLPGARVTGGFGRSHRSG